MANEDQIYFDSNVFRPITREFGLWKKFKEGVDKDFLREIKS